MSKWFYAELPIRIQSDPHFTDLQMKFRSEKTKEIMKVMILHLSIRYEQKCQIENFQRKINSIEELIDLSMAIPYFNDL